MTILNFAELMPETLNQGMKDNLILISNGKEGEEKIKKGEEKIKKEKREIGRSERLGE